MRIELKQVLFPQPKSKIKAGDGKAEGRYKFFTSSPLQTKFHDEANYDEPSLILELAAMRVYIFAMNHSRPLPTAW